jgi:PAS domain S-box-containing protein
LHTIASQPGRWPVPHQFAPLLAIGAADDPLDEDIGEHFVSLIESSDDAIISKDSNGIIRTWNAGATRIFGYTREEAVGHSIRLLIPDDLQREEDMILDRIRRGEHIEHYQSIRRHKSGRQIHVSLTISPIRNRFGEIIGASKIARDITKQKTVEQQLDQQRLRSDRLNQIAQVLARDLDFDRIVQTVTDIATELAGAQFGSFFHNVINEKGDSYQLYTLAGAPRSAFEGFPMPRNTAVFDPTFKGTEIVRSDDIRKDPRYGKSAPYYGQPKGHLPVTSYLAVPVIGRSGEVLGGLFFGHERPGVFDQNAELAQRKAAEEARELVLNEIQHRVKNTLSTVLGIAAQTFKGAPQDQHKTFSARIQALAAAHALLTLGRWDRAPVRDIVDRAIEPFKGIDARRFCLFGPDVELDATKSLTLSMVLHELCTNAVKHGALSRDGGRVDITWEEITKQDRPAICLTWREQGGPSVQPPTRRGFGSTLIERALSGTQGKVALQFEPEGLICTIDILL